jgi:glycosyltransferase involved in cell wall biosynthesis
MLCESEKPSRLTPTDSHHRVKNIEKPLRISVALCTYNGADFIIEQLESLNKQTRLPDEIIISDDNSSDHTTALVESYKKQSKVPIRLFTNIANIGYIKNFEKAISLCNCDIISLCDQDDVWLPEKIALTEEVFLKNPSAGGVFTNAFIVDHLLNSLKYTMWDVVGLDATSLETMNKGFSFDILLKKMIVTGATFAFRSIFLKKILPIPATWFHDAWIAIIIAFYSKLTPLPLPLILYRQHSRSLIGGLKKTLNNKILGALRIDRNIYYQTEINRYIDLQKRLFDEKNTRFNLYNKIGHKLEFIKHRYNYPKNRLLRTALILKSIISKDYLRFSGGIKVAIKDLLMP